MHHHPALNTLTFTSSLFPEVDNQTDIKLFKMAEDSHSTSGSLRFIRNEFAERSASHLLNTIPSVDSITFKEQSYFPNALPHKILLGELIDSDLWAFVFQFGEKPREVRYFTEPKEQSAKPQSVLPDALKNFKLHPPWDKIYGVASIVEKRAMSIFIKYYYLLAGHISDGVGGSLSDYTYRMWLLLDKMATVDLVGTRQVPKVIGTPGSADMDKIREYFRGQQGGSEHMLEELTPVAHYFKKQSDFSNACDMKLYLGYIKGDPTKEVYVYMQKFGNNSYHETRYYIEPDCGRSPPVSIMPDEAIRASLIEPIKWVNNGVGQQEKAKLRIVLMYYFVQAGLLKDVCAETKNIPYRLYKALQDIIRNKQADSSPEIVRNSSPSKQITNLHEGRAVVESKPVATVFGSQSRDTFLADHGMDQDDTTLLEHDQDEHPKGTPQEPDNIVHGGMEAQIQQDISEHTSWRHDNSSPPHIASKNKWEKTSNYNPYSTPVTDSNSPLPSAPGAQSGSTIAAAPTPGKSLGPLPKSRKRSAEDEHFATMHELWAKDAAYTAEINALEEQIEELSMKRRCLATKRSQNRDEIKRQVAGFFIVSPTHP